MNMFIYVHALSTGAKMAIRYSVRALRLSPLPEISAPLGVTDGNRGFSSLGNG